MSRSCAIVLVVCGFAAMSSLPASRAQALSSPYDTSAAAESRSGWDALGGLYALLAQHDALGGHALARKSVRSPSRRLRFGRRSDPDMPPQAPLDEMEELMSLREVRTPVRLRFGRRSDERAVPHIFPQEKNITTEKKCGKLQRAELVSANSTDNENVQSSQRTINTYSQLQPLINSKFELLMEKDLVPEQERDVRAPSMRLRFGRRSDNNMFLMPFEPALPKEVKANGSMEDDRQQD